ncbi:hypothetical protein [Pseudomonas sp. PDM13]|uniref:hypothetical protein n=1 Tax=Pseudomonas sp. PDM13 TaxID=2769255 RepID=UPI0021DF7646|nr:hypothetical protein [Pseudomonas sp. PDM13]MCU9949811.1 hypothetical protein [Pseudomonas sp. PDM13]
MNKEQREQLASDLLAEAEHRRGRVVDLLRNAAAALSAPTAAGVPVVGTRPQTCNGKRCGWCKEGAEPCHYTPPASAQQPAIVLPQRCTEYVGDRDNLQWARGANFMLDELLRLNPHLQPPAPAQGGEA